MSMTVQRLSESIVHHVAHTSRRYSHDYADDSRILYQFTDANGLLGMARERCIHATHFGFVNDQSEGEFGFARLRAIAADLQTMPQDEPFLSLIAHVQVLADIRPGQAEYYIACFSEKNDHHGQWMLYGDSGRGFAVGFLASDLMTQFGGIGVERIRLLKVVYEPDQQEALVRELVKGTAELLRTAVLSGCPNDSAVSLCRDHLYAELSFLCLALKDHRYSDESEWRLCVSSSRSSEEPVEFRAGRFGLTPYKKLAIRQNGNKSKPLKFASIRPGPATDAGAIERSLNLLFRRTGHMGGPPIDRSNLRIRPTAP